MASAWPSRNRGPAHRRSAARLGERVAPPGSGIVGPDLVGSAVTVDMAGDRQVLIRVRRLGGARGRGRAGDVGDRRDVVPVDPMADAQEQAGDEDADAGSGWGGRDGGGDERFHGRGPRAVWAKAYRMPELVATRCDYGSPASPVTLYFVRCQPSDHPRCEAVAWSTVRDRLHAHGLRWTPQRRTLIDVLSTTDGHVTGAELVERCREVDPATTPSTVYRTLDVLEELGLVSHSHGVDGREEFHVLPMAIHGHLHCRTAARRGTSRSMRRGRSWTRSSARAGSPWT